RDENPSEETFTPEDFARDATEEESLDPDIASFEYENEKAKEDDIFEEGSEETRDYWYKDEESPEKDLIEEKANEYASQEAPVEYDVTDVLTEESEDQTLAAEDSAYTEHFEEPDVDDISFDDDFMNKEFDESTEPTVDPEIHSAIRTDVEDLAVKHKAESNRPQGLFSPTTGFGWEAYMIPRLDSELVRAASDEKDLALVTIRIKDIDWNTDAAKKIAEIILQFVKFKDLAFEYKKDGCTAIFQNMNIDKALKAAEELHTQIVTELSKSSLYNQTAIGISSRSLRLISGARLANESEQALEHALEDKESPIVAFKVNPEKYRNYLASEAAKLQGGSD
ncbi:MAG: hypothetical protein J6W63_10655, partial [Treponema sp.]|nr:hypothetical protein [Treponema sp.]